MISRLLLVTCASSLLLAAEPAGTHAPTGTPPWTVSFTTQVRGADRQFVAYNGRTYILLKTSDILEGLGDGQDVAVTAKLRKLPGDRFGLYRVEGLVIQGVGESLAGKLDGDNVHLMGELSADGSNRIFTVLDTASAPSDAQLLQERLTGIGENDWDRRLGVVSWCIDQARIAGNADFWTATADSLQARIVADLCTKGAERKDLALVTRALDLALNQLRDPGLAARVSSPTWIREHGGPQSEAIARRMRGLNYALYKEEWLPRPQALEREYDDRFAELGWKDAEGFYRLGRWVDENAESLPHARERSWRCYQAGFAADPSHAGIARELGVQPQGQQGQPVQAGGRGGLAADFIDLETSLRIPAPANWMRGQTNGRATVWTDPTSETAYVSVQAQRPPVDRNAQWTILSEEARKRPGFVEVGAEEQENGERKFTQLSYTWSDGEQQRFTSISFVSLGENAPAAIIEARGQVSEQASLVEAVDFCVAGTSYQPGESKDPAAP
jgi:hypothetical protein